LLLEKKKPIKITLPDGGVKEGVANQTTPLNIAESISKGLAKAVVIAKVNGELWHLNTPLTSDCSLELFKFDSPEGQKTFWHSSAHILGEALERLYGGSLCIGPALEEGFYYDIHLGERIISQDDFPKLNALVKEIISEKQPFEILTLSKQDALEMFKYNRYKTEIISSKIPDGGNCTVYRSGTLVDLCRGPHLPNTGLVEAFEVTKNSSAYWLGKADNDSLQRVYGISFPTKKQMKEWQTFQEEAAKRDHRVIGKDQELFFFHPYSPGSAFFLPHGTRIYNKLLEFLKGEYRKRGFQEVLTPNIFNTTLWETSGHWQNYQENMFSFECDKTKYALKPMNCPGHCLVFQHRSRSYRELPLRLADFGVLHRNELHGALTGLTRVRRFQQDDAHIFCPPDLIQQEIGNCLEFMRFVYGKFGFSFSLELSTRPEKYLGEIEVWNKAESDLKVALEQFGHPWKLNEGDGAFYGPKIDIHIQDALKRSHQCATVQLDFQLPIRFNLEFSSEKEDQSLRPVIIHRAIFGSVERFMAILTEHTAGKWPFWLSPRQIVIIPVSEKFMKYAESVYDQIHSKGFFVDIERSDKTLQKKIRESQLQQYNFLLVVGDKEEKDGTVNVRTREERDKGQDAKVYSCSVQEILQTFEQMRNDYQ